MDQFLKLMVPEASPSSSPLTPVHTLAFIDLETTGLPFDVGRKNVHITELSVVAIDRQHFEEDFKLRVVQKINLFMKPRSCISVGASSITGLYNDMLEFQKPFDESVLKVLEIFFSRLRSPICLIAHNGNKFDFPLLQAELKRLGLSLPPDITCADTLQGFRIFGYAPSHKAKEVLENDSKSVEANPENTCDLSPVEIDNMLNKDIELFQQIDDHLLTPANHGSNQNHHSTNKNGRNLHSSINLADSETPNQRSELVYGIETPVSNIKSHFPVVKSKQMYNLPKNTNVKRKLFDIAGENSSKALKTDTQNVFQNPKSKQKQGFSLEKLYMYYFGEKPVNSHQAETDCINLCKICQKAIDDFLPWLDENQVPFSQIPSMW